MGIRHECVVLYRNYGSHYKIMLKPRVNYTRVKSVCIRGYVTITTQKQEDNSRKSTHRNKKQLMYELRETTSTAGGNDVCIRGSAEMKPRRVEYTISKLHYIDEYYWWRV